MKFRTAEEIQKLLSLQGTSGLSIAAYCERENIHQNTFYNWRKRFPVSRSTVPVSSFIRLPMQTAPDPLKIDVTLPNGVRLLVPISCDMTVFRQTVRILAPLCAQAR
jgi:transposase-like protein